MSSLSLKDVDVFYGDAQALDGVSLEVPQGSIVAIVGANGAGKSTLIRTIAGIETPQRGQISYKGAAIGGLPSYKVCNLGIGQVAEGRQIFPSLSVLENLEMGALLPRARGKEKSTIEEVFGMGRRCIVRWRGDGMGASGAPGHVRGVDVFQVRDGLITEMFSYVKG